MRIPNVCYDEEFNQISDYSPKVYNGEQRIVDAAITWDGATPKGEYEGHALDLGEDYFALEQGVTETVKYPLLICTKKTDEELAEIAKEEEERQAKIEEAKRAALKASQLNTAAALYVKAAALPRMDAISVCTLYDEWSGKGIAYKKGDWLRYGEDFAYVEQDHTSQEDWTPDAAPSLYTLFKLAPDGIRIWEQPTRAENAFDIGERCHYPDEAGALYESKIDGNTTVPGSDDRYWNKLPE